MSFVPVIKKSPKANRHNCHQYADCKNLDGKYSCHCKNGFEDANPADFGTTSEGTKCKDINECIRSSTTCDIDEECQNTLGSGSDAENGGTQTSFREL